MTSCHILSRNNMTKCHYGKQSEIFKKESRTDANTIANRNRHRTSLVVKIRVWRAHSAYRNSYNSCRFLWCQHRFSFSKNKRSQKILIIFFTPVALLRQLCAALSQALSQTKIWKNEPKLFGSFLFALVRTTGLVVSEASVIAERANLFAEVKRQLHSVQGQTNAVPFADKT